MWYTYLFILFWHVAFIYSLNHFVLAAVACIWYFAPNRHKLSSPICRAFTWALGLHIGTLAFGSLLLAIIWIIQIVLAYIHKKVKEAEAKKQIPKWVSYLVGCLQCYALCFERVIKFINRHAYVETILHSFSFCPAAQRAFSVITSNILRFGALSGITELATLFGKVFIASASALIGHYLLKYEAEFSNVVFETIFPLLVSLILFFC